MSKFSKFLGSKPRGGFSEIAGERRQEEKDIGRKSLMVEFERRLKTVETEEVGSEAFIRAASGAVQLFEELSRRSRVRQAGGNLDGFDRILETGSLLNGGIKKLIFEKIKSTKYIHEPMVVRFQTRLSFEEIKKFISVLDSEGLRDSDRDLIHQRLAQLLNLANDQDLYYLAKNRDRKNGSLSTKEDFVSFESEAIEKLKRVIEVASTRWKSQVASSGKFVLGYSSLEDYCEKEDSRMMNAINNGLMKTPRAAKKQ